MPKTYSHGNRPTAFSPPYLLKHPKGYLLGLVIKQHQGLHGLVEQNTGRKPHSN